MNKTRTILIVSVVGIFMILGIVFIGRIYTNKYLSEKQKQCAVDAQKFLNQFNGYQLILESVYSAKLNTCISYNENLILKTPPWPKSIYDVSKNRILGGYTQIPATDTLTYGTYYYLSNTDQSERKVTREEFNAFLTSIGISRKELLPVQSQEKL